MRREKGELCFHPLPDGPRSNLTLGFQRLTARSVKAIKISKKYVTLGFYLENVRKLLYWPHKV
jgi:hypothetical protein